MRNMLLILGLMGLFALTACSSTTEVVEPAPEPVATQGDEAPAPVVAEVADPEDVHIEGDHLTIDGSIHFAHDDATILEDSHELLDHIAALLNNHADEINHLRIVGHTDIAGGHEHNQDLSERRATAVAEALQARQVAAQLDHSGVGETEPVCSEDTDECHASNRRVEFLIITD